MQWQLEQIVRSSINGSTRMYSQSLVGKKDMILLMEIS
jgi:hypothetical protein